jgi:hypothetical protein
MAGVSHDTMRRWRSTGVAAPHTLAKAQAILASNPTDPTKPIGRPPGPCQVDVHCLWTSTGWIFQAYWAGTNEPAGQPPSIESMPRWPTLEEAHRQARQRYGPRIVAITPELDA